MIRLVKTGALTGMIVFLLIGCKNNGTIHNTAGKQMSTGKIEKPMDDLSISSSAWKVFGVFPRSNKIRIAPQGIKRHFKSLSAEALKKIPAGSCRRYGASLDAVPVPNDLMHTPDVLKIGEVKRKPKSVRASSNGILDLAKVLGPMNAGDSVYVYIPVEVEKTQQTTLSFGADWWMQVWVNGSLFLDTLETGNVHARPAVDNYPVNVTLRKGKNLIVIRFVSGSSSSVLAAGGPGELQKLAETRRQMEQKLPRKGRQPFFKVSEPELAIQAPNDTTAMRGFASYTRLKGREMLLVYHYQLISDVMNDTFYCYSIDNGRTWSKPTLVFERNPEKKTSTTNRYSMTMQAPSGPVVIGSRNPFTGEVIVFSDKRERPAGADPDLPIIFWTQTMLTYAVSRDDGRTLGPARPLVAQGGKFTERHPFDGLFLGKNQTYGIFKALFLDADTFLVPFQTGVLGPNGKVYSPHTMEYSQIVVLKARRKGDGFVWDSAPPVTLDANTESTRGVLEPAMGVLADGSILMVMRGSNATKPELPSRKWFTISRDRGKSWSKTRPWTYDNGENFFSPSACSRLIQHSSGRLFWFGNICPTNAFGNAPRTPLVMGEVDRKTGLLIRSSLTAIRDRKPGMHRLTSYSNFHLYEDRITHELVLYLPCLAPNAKETANTGNLYRYRIAVD
jgi:hypothetical protein